MWGHSSPGRLWAGSEEYQGAGGSLRVWFCGMAWVLEIRRLRGEGSRCLRYQGHFLAGLPTPRIPSSPPSFMALDGCLSVPLGSHCLCCTRTFGVPCYLPTLASPPLGTQQAQPESCLPQEPPSEHWLHEHVNINRKLFGPCWSLFSEPVLYWSSRSPPGEFLW